MKNVTKYKHFQIWTYRLDGCYCANIPELGVIRNGFKNKKDAIEKAKNYINYYAC